MRSRRSSTLLAVLALTLLPACGSKDEPEPSDLTLPISAPMQARERLLHDMKKNTDAAREREKQFDAIVNDR